MEEKRKLEIYPIAQESEASVSFVDMSVHAGFPVPVDAAYQQQPIDLNKELIAHPASTYLVRVVGDSMIEEGIESGDLIVVDRSLIPTAKNVSMVAIDGEWALKRIEQANGRIYLMPGNPKYRPIPVENPELLSVFGVVTWIMKKKV